MNTADMTVHLPALIQTMLSLIENCYIYYILYASEMNYKRLKWFVKQHQVTQNKVTKN